MEEKRLKYDLLLEKLHQNLIKTTKKNRFLYFKHNMFKLGLFLTLLVSCILIGTLFMSIAIGITGDFNPKMIYVNMLLVSLFAIGLYIYINIKYFHNKDSGKKCEDTCEKALERFTNTVIDVKKEDYGFILNMLHKYSKEIDYFLKISEELINIIPLVYSMIWFSLTDTKNNEYEIAKKKMMKSKYVPQAFKDLYIESENELNHYLENVKSEDDIDFILNYLSDNMNFSITLIDLCHKKYITKEKLENLIELSDEDVKRLFG